MSKNQEPTFKHYKATATNGPAVFWTAMPVHLKWEPTIRAAGYNPSDPRVRTGFLEREWNGHPAGCLVVSPSSTDLAAGNPFVVSERPVVDFNKANEQMYRAWEKIYENRGRKAS